MSTSIDFGAIRWDFWYSNSGTCASTRRNLGNPLYRSRAPFWATEQSTNQILFEPTQATMDAEIAWAVAAGLSYWAFLLYSASGSSPEGMQGYDLYQTSANKGDIKWCQIRPVAMFGSTGNYATQVAEMLAMCQQANYQNVLTNRPLVYIYYSTSELASYWGGSNANLKAAIDSFRSAATTAGLGNPYIVLMYGGGTGAAAAMTALGCEAISTYVSRLPDGLNLTFADLDTGVQAYWEEMRAAAVAASGKNVPICMMGWERSPRIDRPVAWELTSQIPFFGSSRPFDLPTSGEITSQIQACVDFIGAHTSDHDANTALIYAWNEFDEGGWICPTLGDLSGSRVSAIASVLI